VPQVPHTDLRRGIRAKRVATAVPLSVNPVDRWRIAVQELPKVPHTGFWQEPAGAAPGSVAISVQT